MFEISVGRVTLLIRCSAAGRLDRNLDNDIAGQVRADCQENGQGRFSWSGPARRFLMHDHTGSPSQARFDCGEAKAGDGSKRADQNRRATIGAGKQADRLFRRHGTMSKAIAGPRIGEADIKAIAGSGYTLFDIPNSDRRSPLAPLSACRPATAQANGP